MANRNFLTENARITDAYARMYSRPVHESDCKGGKCLLRSLRGDLPIDGKGSPKTGSKLGVRKVLPFDKRDAKNCCGHSVPLRKNRQFQKITNDWRSKGGVEFSAGLKDKLGVRKVLPFEKRDEHPTTIGRISKVRDVGCSKRVRESAEKFDDFEEIEDVETTAAETPETELDASKCEDVLDLVLTTFDQLYDNLSDDDKETVDEVRAEIEALRNPEEDDEESEEETEKETDAEADDGEDLGESAVNEAGPKIFAGPKYYGTMPKGNVSFTGGAKTPKGTKGAGGSKSAKKNGGTKSTGGSKGPKGGKKDAWNSIENLPRKPGESAFNYAQRNGLHKIKEYAKVNGVTIAEAIAALGLTYAAYKFGWFGGGPKSQPMSADPQQGLTKPTGDNSTTWVAVTSDEDKKVYDGKGSTNIDPDLLRKAAAYDDISKEYAKYAAKPKGDDDEGYLGKIAKFPGALISSTLGGIGTGAESLAKGVGGVATNLAKGAGDSVSALTNGLGNAVSGITKPFTGDSGKDESPKATPDEKKTATDDTK